MQAEPTLICLNQKCLHPHHRLFDLHSSQQHSLCKQWCADINQIFQTSISPHSCLKDHIQLNLNKQPIEKLKLIANMLNYKTMIQQVFTELKKKVGEKLDELKYQSMRQYEKVIEEAKQGLKVVQNYVTNKNKQEEMLKKYWDITNKGSLSLLDMNNLQMHLYKNILPQFSTIKQFLLHFTKTDHRFCAINNEAKLKVKEMMESSQIPINEKMQKITNAFNCDIVKPVYDDKVSNYYVQCFICKQTVYSIKTQLKRFGALETLMMHLHENHVDTLYSEYAKKYLKVEMNEVGVNDFMKEALSYPFKTIWVVDRENAGSFQKPTLERNELWIEIVNKHNKNLSRGKFISAESTKKDAADILITIVIDRLLTQTHANVKLITKDHFGEVLQEIHKSHYGTRMQCLHIKYLGLNSEIDQKQQDY